MAFWFMFTMMFSILDFDLYYEHPISFKAIKPTVVKFWHFGDLYFRKRPSPSMHELHYFDSVFLIKALIKKKN